MQFEIYKWSKSLSAWETPQQQEVKTHRVLADEVGRQEAAVGSPVDEGVVAVSQALVADGVHGQTAVLHVKLTHVAQQAPDAVLAKTQRTSEVH